MIGSAATGIANQDHAVFLRFVSKSTTIKNRLERGHFPLELDDSWCVYLSADIYFSWCKLGYGYNDLGISQACRALRRNLFA